jgi:hypothetical protein
MIQSGNGFRTPALTEAPHFKLLLSVVSKSAEAFRTASEEWMNEEQRILTASDSGIAIRSFGDISDALGVCLGSAGLILTETDLAREFFDLRTGWAGELFQKFTNYKLRVAIVLPDPEAYGERFGELAYEHRSHNLIRFVRSEDEAKAWLST